MGLKLPSSLAREFDTDKTCRRLIAIAMRTMTEPHVADHDAGIRGVARKLRNQFLLGQGLRFYTAQCALAFAELPDIVGRCQRTPRQCPNSTTLDAVWSAESLERRRAHAGEGAANVVRPVFRSQRMSSLLAQSRHPDRAGECPLSGVKQTSH